MNLDKNEYDDHLKQKYKRKKSREFRNEDQYEKRNSKKVRKNYIVEDDSEDDIDFIWDQD
ncbi:MAG: hypothetical protein JEZ08_11635 [Clostridiales bacterium]|nr:hypothetical protein [Clostridiales bacterium]